MIIVLKCADFSASNIGTLYSYRITSFLGKGAAYTGPISINKNTPFSARIAIEEGYELGAAGITITMGGITLDDAYFIGGNIITIYISNVTSDIMINIPTVNTSTGEEDNTEITTADITEQFTWTEGSRVLSDTGELSTDTNWKYSNYVDISGYKQLTMTMNIAKATITTSGCAFYDADKKYISGVNCTKGAASNGMEVRTFAIPSNAKYIRTMWFSKNHTDWTALGMSNWEFSCIASTGGGFIFSSDFANELNSVIEKVSTIQNSSSNKTIEFIAFSDIHMGNGSAYATDLTNMLQAIDHLTHNLDIKFVVNLGDTIHNPHQETNYGADLYNGLVNTLAKNNAPYICLSGNHDWIPHIMRRTYATNVKEAVFDTLGSWFYIDDEGNNIRFIMLDDSDRGGDAAKWTTNPPTNNLADRSWQQLHWLANTALKTTKNIIFLTHQCLGGQPDHVVVPNSGTNVRGANYYIAYQIACAFEDGASGSATYTSSSVEIDTPTEITWDFTNQGVGNILCHFFGHTHGDTFIAANANANEANKTMAESKLNEIAIDNALSNNDVAYYGINNTKTTGTVNGVAFDVVSVDLLTNKVTCHRFGTGQDRTYTLT